MQTMTSKTPWTGPEAGPLPVLAPSPAASGDQETLKTLRRFHLAGPLPEPEEAWLDMDILPALLHPYRDASAVRSDYPLVLLPETAEPAPGGDAAEFCLSLPDFLQSMAARAESTRVLADNLPRLERQVREDNEGTTDARNRLAEAGTALRKTLALAPASDGELGEALDRLVAAVPEGTVLLPLTERTPLELFHHAARRHLRAAQEVFRRDLRGIAEKGRSLLDADDLKRPESRNPARVQGSVGSVGSRFLDSSAMAGMMGKGQGSGPLAAELRARLEQAVRELEDETPTSGSRLFTLIHDGSVRAGALSGLSGWQITEDEDPCGAAARRFDETAAALADTLRARRLARLIYDGNYDPDRHDVWLSRLDWRSFTREELRLIQPIVVLISADHAARRGLLSLSRLILSGRPVQVILLEQPARNPGAEAGSDALTGFRFEPAYLGVSHREAWVQQTTVARPGHLLRGYLDALAGARTALHVVAHGFEPRGARPRLGSWLYAGAAVESRAHPCFHYDPEAGHSWARRLDFSENPAPEADWPVYPLAVKDGGAERALSLPFTFADFALLDPGYARHFRLVPPGIPDAELVPLDRYLDLPEETAVQKVPVVWGVDGRGTLCRMALTRQMARAAADRLGYWRTLQELAGLRNEYVTEAAARAKTEAEAAAAARIEELEAAHRGQLERTERRATEDAVTRLTAALMEVDVAALAEPASGFETLAGRSVDDVAAMLLSAVQESTLTEEPGGPTGERIDQAAEKLLELIDPDRLEENAS